MKQATQLGWQATPTSGVVCGSIAPIARAVVTLTERLAAKRIWSAVSGRICGGELGGEDVERRLEWEMEGSYGCGCDSVVGVSMIVGWMKEAVFWFSPDVDIGREKVQLGRLPSISLSALVFLFEA